MMPGIAPSKFADWIARLEGPAMKIIARSTQWFTSNLVSGGFIYSRNRLFLSVSPLSLPLQQLHRRLSLWPMPRISLCSSPNAILALARRAPTPAQVKRSKDAGLFETNQDAGAFRAVLFHYVGPTGVSGPWKKLQRRVQMNPSPSFMTRRVIPKP